MLKDEEMVCPFCSEPIYVDLTTTVWSTFGFNDGYRIDSRCTDHDTIFYDTFCVVCGECGGLVESKPLHERVDENADCFLAVVKEIYAQFLEVSKDWKENGDKPLYISCGI